MRTLCRPCRTFRQLSMTLQEFARLLRTMENPLVLKVLEAGKNRRTRQKLHGGDGITPRQDHVTTL